MKYDSSESKSGDIVDRRGQGGGGGFGGLGFPGMGQGGGLPFPMPGAGGGKGKAGCLLPILMIVLSMAFGGSKMFGGGTGIDMSNLDQLPGAPSATEPEFEAVRDDETAQFVRWLATDVNDFWAETFSEGGKTYERTKVVLFSGSVQSGCGSASAAVGPFYCPADKLVYLDTTFFDELARRFGAPGDFAQAYVIAHEVGHHVQNVLGIAGQVRALQQDDPDRANELSVRMELQADCLAGVYGQSTWERQLMEAGDLEEGLRAASAVGDDSIQEKVAGRVEPESFTHGTSDQRVSWFKKGYQSGDSNMCDTFSNDI